MELSREQVLRSVRGFKERRDNLLHEDDRAFDHHLMRFVEYCESDPVLDSVLGLVLSRSDVSVENWWSELDRQKPSGGVVFPNDVDDELSLRFQIVQSIHNDTTGQLAWRFGSALGAMNTSEIINLLRTIVIRPLAAELTNRVGDAADLVTPEALRFQAVDIERIPRPNETRIFLSRKTTDNELVQRYYNTLEILGFEPWLDESDIHAGLNIDRAIARGFEESCAAVFFITENFEDDRYLGAEIEHALEEKRRKGRKFAIIVLRYPDGVEVPRLLQRVAYKNIENDLEGFYQLIRALPIEAGPIRWKESVVTDQ